MTSPYGPAVTSAGTRSGEAARLAEGTRYGCAMANPPTRTPGWTIGHIWGARIVAHPTTILLIGILAIIAATGPGTSSAGAQVAEGILLAFVLFTTVIVHELGHALAARAFKREVTEIVITLVGGHTTFDATNITPGVAGVTSAAGPAANALLALAAFGVSRLGVPDGVRLVAEALVLWNLVLAIFNALPGAPLDGGGVLEAIVWKATGRRTAGMRTSAWGGRMVLVCYAVYVLISNFAAGATPSMFQLSWGLLLFVMMWPATTATLRAARILDRVATASVPRMMRGGVGVPFDTLLVDAVRLARSAECDEVIVLASDGQPAGHFPLEAVAAVPEERRATTPLSALTIPLPRGAVVSASATGPELLAQVRQWWGKTDVLAVVDGGEAVGVVRLAEVSERLR